ncbi:MAG: DNA topoisomerase 4 subunit A, partial [Clostridia bacterium]|nr:DNA topoisomerase 4 subunit A [Clostridia bacterium]
MSEDLRFENQKIINVELEKEMKSSFIDYAMSVIVARALPDVRDGLKPVHRRILYAMYEDHLTSDRPYRKAATTVGNVLGRYHPHGDASVYDAMVRMAQDFSLRYPLIDGHGNFGSVDGDPPAAYRYTEARMSKIAEEMMADIEKETIQWNPNFDDKLQEPSVVPSGFPQLLVNGSSGIAVGMATNIPPHNLGEVIDGVCCLIDDPEAGLDKLGLCVKGPDFPTGGIILGRAGIKAAYATGKGKITVRARTEIEEYKEGRFRIVITELPYQVNKARLVEHIADLHKDKRIEGITDIRDESDREGMRVVIEMRKDINPQVMLNQLFKLTEMQENFSVNMLALVDNQPKILSLKACLQHYLDFRFDVIVNRTKYLLKKAQDRAHILEGLAIACDNIDEVIHIIRNSYDNAKENLMNRFGISEIQAQSILEMQLRRLQGLEREKIENELNELRA